MRKCLCLCLTLYFSFFLSAQEGLPPDKMSELLIREGNIFAIQLYQVVKDGKENLAISPYAVLESMVLPLAGSRDTTYSQIARVFRYKGYTETIVNVFREINQRLGKETPYFFASSLWVQKGMFTPYFQSLADRSALSDVRQVDFFTRSGVAAGEMNRWVREVTEGEITEMVPPKVLTNKTRMVVLSAAYLKGRWEKTFDLRESRQMPFFRNKYETSTVPAMKAVRDFNYLLEDDFSLLEIPYEAKKNSGTKVSLLIFLPHELYELKKIERALTAEKIQRWVGLLEKRRVALELPRFRVSDFFSLGEALSKMGLIEPFTEKANFEGIREGSTLSLDKIWHKVFLDVDEQGSEGGLSAGRGGEIRREWEAPLTFAVNHPFLYMIIDRDSGSILWMGKVSYPGDTSL